MATKKEKPAPPVTVLLVGNAAGPSWASDFDIAVLYLNEETCLTLLERFGLAQMCKQACESFYHLAYGDAPVGYYGSDLLDDTPIPDFDVEVLEDGQWHIVMDDDWEPPVEAEMGSTDSDTVNVWPDHISYSSSVKHASDSPEVCSPELTRELLSTVLGEIHRRKQGRLSHKRERHVELTDGQ